MPSFTVVSLTAVLAVSDFDNIVLRLQGFVRRKVPGIKEGCDTTPGPRRKGRSRYPNHPFRQCRLSAP
jgi:hypothetical protein